MSEKLIGEMDNAEFEQMIEAFIERPAGLDDEIPGELVFAMLDQAEQSKHALELESVIVDNRLILSAPAGAALPTNVREIEVNLPGVRVIISVDLTATKTNTTG